LTRSTRFERSRIVFASGATASLDLGSDERCRNGERLRRRHGRQLREQRSLSGHRRGPRAAASATAPRHGTHRRRDEPACCDKQGPTPGIAMIPRPVRRPPAPPTTTPRLAPKRATTAHGKSDQSLRPRRTEASSWNGLKVVDVSIAAPPFSTSCRDCRWSATKLMENVMKMKTYRRCRDPRWACWQAGPMPNRPRSMVPLAAL